MWLSAVPTKSFASFLVKTEAEFKEFEPLLKSAKIRFKIIAGLNLEHLIQF